MLNGAAGRTTVAARALASPMPGRRLAIFGPSPISAMEAFTQTLLAELRRAGDGVVPDWIHVDTSTSRSV